MKDGTIYIFAAYKFNSKYYKKEHLEMAIKEAIKNAQTTLRKKFKDLTLQFIEQKQIQPGEYVGEFIRNSLDKAMITIFDLSDREPNVTFELGYSLGMAKYRFARQDGYDILIQCNKVNPRDTISDLLGRFIVLYEYSNSHQKDEYKKIQRKIEGELKRKIGNLLEDDRILKRLIWRMYQEDVYVICPYIPPEDQERYGIRSTLAEYGDFNTVYEVCTFLKGVLNCNVKYIHSEEAKSIRDLLNNNIVIVGGPMWNKYTGEIMDDDEYDLPYKYNWSPEEDIEDYIQNKITNEEYYTSKKRKNSKEVITKDYGIFAVLPNKYAEDKVIILINGITSAGGLGVARAFTDDEVSHQNCKLLVKNVGLKNYFITLVESDIRWGEFAYPKKIKKSWIFSYDQEKNLWSNRRA